MFQRRYDKIPLPSKGLSYENKCSEVLIYHLDGSDETILTAPNMIANGTMIDTLLDAKVQPIEGKPFIHPKNMVAGDRMAILIFLRSQLKRHYTINVTDPISEKIFTHDFDLFQLKMKEPVSLPNKDGFISYKMENAIWDEDSKKYIPADIKYREMTGTDEEKIRKKMSNSMNQKNLFSIEKMKMIIHSINENTDEKYINQFVHYIPLESSRRFNKFIEENSCGYDFNIKVPNAISGGVVDTFLNIKPDFLYPRL